jgi:hypothetical protein
MSRRINTGVMPIPVDGVTSPLALGKKRTRGNGDDYFGRLAGYIPAEMVGLYLAATGVVPLNSDGAPKCAALWIVFLLNFALVPVYFIFATTRDKKKPLWVQVLLASLAFPIWVFALGGPFKCFAWYESWIASISLMFVTVAFGLVSPRPGS